MRTFRDILLENLTYKMDPEEILNFKGLDKYKMTAKGDIMLYSDENNNSPIFSIDIKKNKLVVLKQGWQLMNVKRGF